MNKIDIFNDGKKILLELSLNDMSSVFSDKEKILSILKELENEKPTSIKNNKFISLIKYDDTIVVINDSFKNDNDLNKFVENAINKYSNNQRKINIKRSIEKCGGIVLGGALLIGALLVIKDNCIISDSDINKDDIPTSSSFDDIGLDSSSSLDDSGSIFSTNSDNSNFANPISIDNSDIDQNNITVKLDYDYINDDTYHDVEMLYGPIITKYANMYGLSPELMIAVCCQESRGNHSEEVSNGGAVGLMQVEYAPWIAQGSIKAYNYETNNYETYIINDENIRDLDSNIKIRCMITAYYIERMNGNPLMGLQCCIGEGNMNKILSAYANDCGLSVDEIKNKYDDLGWIDYTSFASSGDTNYVRNVLRFLDDDTIISTKSPNGSLSSIVVERQNNIVKK